MNEFAKEVVKCFDETKKDKIEIFHFLCKHERLKYIRTEVDEIFSTIYNEFKNWKTNTKSSFSAYLNVDCNGNLTHKPNIQYILSDKTKFSDLELSSLINCYQSGFLELEWDSFIERQFDSKFPIKPYEIEYKKHLFNGADEELNSWILKFYIDN